MPTDHPHHLPSSHSFKILRDTSKVLNPLIPILGIPRHAFKALNLPLERCPRIRSLQIFSCLQSRSTMASKQEGPC